MSLVNQTCWVVGGVGVIGRGITRALLQSGATVIVNSNEESRLQKLASDLANPEKLILVQGSLLPGAADATVNKVLSDTSKPLNHVVAHGAVRYWSENKAGCDETYFLNNRSLLDMGADEFAQTSNQLSKLHFSAAQSLLPSLKSNDGNANPSYTFVTGDGGGHVSGKRSAMGELNSYHIWGLSAAMRSELQNSNVACREVRVGLPINRSETERLNEPRDRPLSEDIGDLCAGLVGSNGKADGDLIHIDSQQTLEESLIEFDAAKDKNIGLPSIWEFSGSL
jgi:NAD(P)-dependent dehydrogenase (short-subunit alcohol dehydrogenase family)